MKKCVRLKKVNGLYLHLESLPCSLLLKYNVKLKIQDLKNNKTPSSEVTILWFQVILKLRVTPCLGGHTGTVKTKGKNIYKISIYNNERISIQP